MSLIAAAPARAVEWTRSEHLRRYFTWGPVFLSRLVRGLNPLYDQPEWYPSRPIEAASTPFRFGALQGFEFPVVVSSVPGNPDIGPAEPTQLDAYLKSLGTTAFIVLKDGALAYERMFNGHARDTPSISQSIAKSFTSALIGILIGEGAIASADDSVTRYVPELDPKVFGAITIRHLLEMSSGLAYSMGYMPWDEQVLFTYFPDLPALARDLKAVEAPGTAFHYNDLNTVLLGMVLQGATGRRPSELLEEKLWKPLGMEYPASWCTDREDGFELMASGLSARPIDYAKLGQLYLDGGLWNGRQIVPASWVAESTAPRADDARPWRVYSEWKEHGGYYGLHWWGFVHADGARTFTALGDFGQFIFVYPAKRVVIVRTGDRWGMPFYAWPEFLKLTADNLRPHCEGDGASVRNAAEETE